MDTRYFVTGATGFIGGRVVRQLVAAGHQVTAIVRDPSRAQDLRAIGVDIRPGDVTVEKSLWSPMNGADGVFHIAGWYKIGGKDRAEGERINVLGTRNVLNVMKGLRIPKGVYTSTLAVFSDTHGQLVNETYRHEGPWLTEYDRTKWVAHYEVAEPMIRDGLPLVIVQPGVTYGPGDTSEIRPTFVRYLQRRLRAIPKGTAYCWGHVDDTARAHLLAMEKGIPGQSYIIAGFPHTLAEAFQIAERITGIPAPRTQISPSVLRALAFVARSERLRDLAGVTYLGNNAKARRDLGYEPRPLEPGLRETLAYEMQLLGSTPPAK
ncbi:MAG: NAD-dependent epimerase/dehydratase family protein [Thermoplasmata archaeon]